MFKDMPQAMSRPPLFRSAREEAGTNLIEDTSITYGQTALDKRIEDEAIYYSRRALEERVASTNGECRKSREVHLELAQAYDFRAHLLTRELRHLDDLFAL